MKEHPPEAYELLQWIDDYHSRNPGSTGYGLQGAIPEHLQLWLAYLSSEGLANDIGVSLYDLGKLALQTRKATRGDRPKNDETRKKGPKLKLDDQAVAVFFSQFRHLDRIVEKQEVAAAMGKAPQSLTRKRCPELHKLITEFNAAIRSHAIPEGTKYDGTVEAVDEEDH